MRWTVACTSMTEGICTRISTLGALASRINSKPQKKVRGTEESKGAKVPSDRAVSNSAGVLVLTAIEWQRCAEATRLLDDPDVAILSLSFFFCHAGLLKFT